MFPQVRILGKVVVECHKCTSVEELATSLSGSDQVGIIAAGDHDTDFLLHVTNEVFDLDGDAGHFTNPLYDLVVFRRRFAWICLEHRESDRLLRFVFRNIRLCYVSS